MVPLPLVKVGVEPLETWVEGVVPDLVLILGVGAAPVCQEGEGGPLVREGLWCGPPREAVGAARDALPLWEGLAAVLYHDFGL